jgi:hypothetical protein
MKKHEECECHVTGDINMRVHGFPAPSCTLMEICFLYSLFLNINIIFILKKYYYFFIFILLGGCIFFPIHL